MTRVLSMDGLVKVRVDLPSHETLGGESVWAEPLGADLYRLRNTPFYAFDLHFGDVVRAVPHQVNELPTIREVIERSGHKTLRVVFGDQASEAKISGVLQALNERATNYEHARGRFYSLNVRPEADYPAVCDYLWQLEQEGILEYETGTKAQPPTDRDR